ncbi:MAG: DNA-directed RNA polymerase subunit K [Nitrososphaerota archaeon]|nr:DNA-directed RNA polymerase subunit K [Candidatus Bathyarchaeota archaeon]MCX8161550.1 DNA-directed RNA polymerase subunit K [Candidatus Bathyarchaeota archaeon]MDW8061322.1 DNA-directed RNA polymerase subunit K [Nitrososphaerota archaeon]
MPLQVAYNSREAYGIVGLSGLSGSSDTKADSGREARRILGPPRLTKYEKARIVGVRALQISMGAPILVRLPPNIDKSPFSIALYELEKAVLPITIRRRLPDGSFQDIPLKWLIEGGRDA